MSTILKNLIVIAMTSSAIAAQASWDVTVGSNNNEYLYASADSFAADGNLRFARQMTSTDTPDANGFLYVETIAQFNCTKNAMQVVKAVGFKSWDDNGQSVDSMLGSWRDIKNGGVKRDCYFMVIRIQRNNAYQLKKPEVKAPEKE